MRMFPQPPPEFSEKDHQRISKAKRTPQRIQHAALGRITRRSMADFFEQNQWIFGYGLNYVILKSQESPLLVDL